MKFNTGFIRVLALALFASLVLADIDKTADGAVEASNFNPVMFKGGHGGGGSSGGSSGSISGSSSSDNTTSGASTSFTSLEGPVNLQTVLITLSVMAIAQDLSRRML